MAALCQKSCDFSHLRLGTSQTYNSLLLFYRFCSILQRTQHTAQPFRFCWSQQKRLNKFQRNQTEAKSNLNISKAGLRRKSCNFNHLKSGTSRTYNSPLLFYRLRSIHDVHSTTLNLSTLLIPAKKIKQFQRNQTKITTILPSPNNTVRNALDACKVHSSRIKSSPQQK